MDTQAFASWRPQDYLDEYYREVQPDEQATLAFLCEMAAVLPAPISLLDVGCGPTIHHLLPFATRAARFHLADLLEENLLAVDRWLRRRPTAHDWSSFAEYVLRCELGRAPSTLEVQERLEAVRRRVSALSRADIRNAAPLPDTFQAVLCCYCPDSMTADAEEWRQCVQNVGRLVAPGGWMILTALGSAQRYRVGQRHYPSPNLGIEQVSAAIEGAGFPAARCVVRVERVRDDAGHGFGEVILAAAKRH